jgi:hypothetical protein
VVDPDCYGRQRCVFLFSVVMFCALTFSSFPVAFWFWGYICVVAFSLPWSFVSIVLSLSACLLRVVIWSCFPQISLVQRTASTIHLPFSSALPLKACVCHSISTCVHSASSEHRVTEITTRVAIAISGAHVVSQGQNDVTHAFPASFLSLPYTLNTNNILPRPSCLSTMPKHQCPPAQNASTRM